jgi:hypothetical protein
MIWKHLFFRCRSQNTGENLKNDFSGDGCAAGVTLSRRESMPGGPLLKSARADSVTRGERRPLAEGGQIPARRLLDQFGADVPSPANNGGFSATC